MSAERLPTFDTERLPDEMHVRVFVSRFLRITPQNWTARDVYSSFWRLYVNNRDGAGVELEDGSYVPLAPRRVHVIPAWVRFDCRIDRPVDHCYVHFDVVGLPGTIVRRVFDRPVTLAPDAQLDESAARWTGRMRFAPADAQRDLAVLCEVKSLTYLALAALFRGVTPEEQARCFRHLLGGHTVTPAIDYIESHLSEPTRNRDLAQLCSVSEDHFIRLFRECLGQTPAQYALDRRVSTAAQKLVFGDDSIERIAEQTGFENRFHFSRVFRRRMGLPPAAYRKAGRV